MNRRAMLAIAAGFAAALPSLVMPGNGATAQTLAATPGEADTTARRRQRGRSRGSALRRAIVHPMGSAGPGRKQAGRRFHCRHQRLRWCQGRSCSAVRRRRPVHPAPVYAPESAVRCATRSGADRRPRARQHQHRGKSGAQGELACRPGDARARATGQAELGRDFEHGRFSISRAFSSRMIWR